MRATEVKTYGVSMSILCERGCEQEQREQRRALDREIDVEMLVMRVGAVANGTQAVERRGIQARRVAVGRPARGSLGELEADLAAEAPREPPQGPIAWRRLESGPPDPAFDYERAAGRGWLEPPDSGIDALGIGLRAIRTSTTARLSGAMTLGRSPPSTVPTFTVTPRAGSLSAKSFWMTWERSSIALTPLSGS